MSHGTRKKTSFATCRPPTLEPTDVVWKAPSLAGRRPRIPESSRMPGFPRTESGRLRRGRLVFKLDSKCRSRRSGFVRRPARAEAPDVRSANRFAAALVARRALDRLSFGSAQGGTAQVFVIPRDGGEAVPLTDVAGAIPTPRGLNALQWSPERGVAGVSDGGPRTEEDGRKREAKDDAIAFEQNPKYVRLWVVDVRTKSVAMRFAREPARSGSSPGIPIRDSSRGRFRRPHTNGPGTPTAWSASRRRREQNRSGSRGVRSRCRSGLPTGTDRVHHVELERSRLRRRRRVAGRRARRRGAQRQTEGIVASMGWAEWSADGAELLAIGHDTGGTGLYRINAQTGDRARLWWRQAAVAEAHWPRFSSSREGTLAACTRMPIVRATCDPARAGRLVYQTRLTRLHPQADEARDRQDGGPPLEGGRRLGDAGAPDPAGRYEPARRYPLVMWVHGDRPASARPAITRLSDGNQLLAAAGYAEFSAELSRIGGLGTVVRREQHRRHGGRTSKTCCASRFAGRIGIADPQRLAIAGCPTEATRPPGPSRRPTFPAPR